MAEVDDLRMDMRLREPVGGSELRLCLYGDWDGHGIEQLRRALRPMALQPVRMEVDLCQLRHLDDQMAGLMLGWARELRRQGGELELRLPTHLQPKVERLGLQWIIPVTFTCP